MSVSLVCGLTQSRKTRKTFDVLSKKLDKVEGKAFVIFITQANCSIGASQLVNRARDDSRFKELFGERIYKSADLEEAPETFENTFVADFWNSRNMNRITSFIERINWENEDTDIYMIIDEADSGSVDGLISRLKFIRSIEELIGDKQVVHLIMITATVANLSKSIYTIAGGNYDIFKDSVCANLLSTDANCEHYFVEPVESYVGPSWFIERPERLHLLKFPKKTKEQTRDEWLGGKTDTICRQLNRLDSIDKRLSLIVISTRKDDHGEIGTRLLNESGYNVVVELNSDHCKDYVVNYKGVDECIHQWHIPFQKIERLADRGALAHWQDPVTHEFKDTLINSRDDLTLSHVLQAALFVKTRRYHDEIIASIDEIERRKLMVLSEMMNRPRNYPGNNLTVALVAGHLASRGTTIQNPMINFVCTSHCFTDTIDISQRGAINAQRFGRVCGLLLEAYKNRERDPMLIATEEILRDALSNEYTLLNKSREIVDGELISLKEFIDTNTWKRFLKKTKDAITDVSKKIKEVKVRQSKVKINIRHTMKEREDKPEQKIKDPCNNGMRTLYMENKVIELLRSSPNKTMELSNAVLKVIDPELNDFLNSQKRRLFTNMSTKGLIVNIEPKKGIWRLISQEQI